MKFRVVKPLIVGLIFLTAALTILAASKEIRDNIISIAGEQLGQFYEMDEYTGGWPPGFDCSGLVSYSYLQAGVKGFSGTTPNSHGPNTTALVGMSDPVLGELYPGDLIFLNGTYDKNLDGVVNAEDLYTHVGIYAGNDIIIHAGSPVQKAKLSEWKNIKKFAGARRIKVQYWPNNDNGYIADVTANAKTVGAVAPTIYKNPFQDFYDFYPKDGESQKCIKSALGNKFVPFYNGDSIPTREDLKPAERCFGGDESQFNFLPPTVQQCLRVALGTNFDKPFTDLSFRIEPEAEKQITLCPAFQEFNAKVEALDKYTAWTSRDTKRVSDIKQIQTALELYFNDKNRYPNKLEETTPIYFSAVPKAPKPADGTCSEIDNTYNYQLINNNTYQLNFCLGQDAASYKAGKQTLSSIGATPLVPPPPPQSSQQTQPAPQSLYEVTATVVNEQNHIITEPLSFGITNLITNEYNFGSIHDGKLRFMHTNGSYKLDIHNFGLESKLFYSTTIDINNSNLNLGFIIISQKSNKVAATLVDGRGNVVSKWHSFWLKGPQGTGPSGDGTYNFSSSDGKMMFEGVADGKYELNIWNEDNAFGRVPNPAPSYTTTIEMRGSDINLGKIIIRP